MYSILFLWSMKVQSVLGNINGCQTKICLSTDLVFYNTHGADFVYCFFLYPNKVHYEVVISRKFTLNTRKSHRTVFTSNLDHQCLFTPCIFRLHYNRTFAFIFQCLTLGVDKCVHLTAIDHRNNVLRF